MSRYILIDNYTGYIFGDTADMPLDHQIDGEAMRETGNAALTPEMAAQWLDESIVGVYGRTYERVARLANNETGYRVYRADIHGSDAVAVVHDGQDRDTIAAVERDCPHVATIACRDAA